MEIMFLKHCLSIPNRALLILLVIDSISVDAILNSSNGYFLQHSNGEDSFRKLIENGIESIVKLSTAIKEELYELALFFKWLEQYA